MRIGVETILGKLIVWALVLVTLLITPLWSMDPINPIKMAALSSIAFMGLGVLLANHRIIEIRRFKVPMAFVAAFVVWLIVVFVTSGGEKLQQLFGANGRNTGLITYLSFSILFIVSMLASKREFLSRFLRGSLIVGLASLAYGVIQSIGLDPFKWVALYSPVFGFLGNPNFQSSLLGILGVIVFTQLFSQKLKLKFRIASLLYLFTTVYVIYETDSQQGFLILLSGSAISLGLFLGMKSRLFGYIYLCLGTIGFLSVLFGTLNKCILASVLYKDSVTYRGDYWRAGWNMTLENPIIGVGLDSYGDWYRRSRTLEATLRRGPDVTSNAAHNVYLEISSYGGFPLLFLYAGLMALVVVSAIKVLKREKSFNPGFVGLVAAWIAFQAQSIISINQIGLAIWGWVISGLIIGYEVNTRSALPESLSKDAKKGSQSAQISNSSLIGVIAGFVFGVLVSMPPYMASAKFKGALETGDSRVVESAAYIWPMNFSNMVQVSKILNNNELGPEGLKVALDAVERFPDNYAVWANLNSMNSASEKQKTEALLQMKRLDPLNPNLK